MKIYLVGLPGSGKSTIGKDLSKILNLPLIDTDDVICSREKSTVDEIFQNKGETYFREYEKNILHELSQLPKFIISTGGGLPCFYDNMDVINKTGLSIFLDVPTSTIVERLWSHDNQNRPLLKGKTKEDLLLFLKDKHSERLPFYSKSEIIFKGNSINAKEITEELKKRNLIT